MEEEVELLLEDTNERMEKSIQHLENELVKIRAGKANPNMLDGISVEYYGTMTPLNQVSNISSPDPRTITIQPWEKNMIAPIEKAILQANIGLNPDNNGEVIHINVPILTEERRKELVKQVRTEGENTKVGIRNARRDANEEIKKMQKEGLAEDLAKNTEDEVQKLTNDYSEKVEQLMDEKEEDIMKV